MVGVQENVRQYEVEEPSKEGNTREAMFNDNVIKLDKYREPESRILSGREKGINARKDSKIDELVERSRKLYIEIPKHILAISPSFLEALLYNVVNKFGVEGFQKRVIFTSQENNYDIAEDLEEALDRIQYRENILC